VQRRLQAGDEIDVGGDVVFRVVELPGHSPGSVGLFNNVTRELFTGDALYDTPLDGSYPLYDILIDSDPLAYAASMELIIALGPSVVVSHCTVCPHATQT